MIGHWRSGTTFLHQLLACDPTAATARNRLTMAPQVALILKPLIRCIVPYVITSIHPIDHVPWSADDPQEDEIRLARLIRNQHGRDRLPKTLSTMFSSICSESVCRV
ncbi:sulfotransferase [Synechococcus sp. MIT S1220]|uniref:sulfotransferase n=1 Tax=Synechococcus sp. MIT S1220 TaxID=3082549 RepID=UPI0039AF7C7D